MTRIRTFFSKLGHYFPIFEKGEKETSPLSPPACCSKGKLYLENLHYSTLIINIWKSQLHFTTLEAFVELHQIPQTSKLDVTTMWALHLDRISCLITLGV